MSTRLPAQTPSPTALTHRLRRLAWAVRGLVLLGAPLVVGLPLLALVWPEAPAALDWSVLDPRLTALAQGGVTPEVQRRLAWVGLLPAAVALDLLWQLWRLFGEYLRGEVFGRRALACLRRLALGVLLLGLVQPLAHTLGALAASWDNPPGQRMLVVALSSNDYGLLLVGLVFLAIARVMSEAARVAEENQGFV